MRVRYTEWDGSQRLRLDPDRVFEKLAGHFSQTGDFRDALDRLAREGLEDEGLEVAGLNAILENVEKLLAGFYDRFDVDHALDRHRSVLDDLVASEKDAAAKLPDARARRRRESFLSCLPWDVDDKINRLAHYSFVDRDSAQRVADLTEDIDDIGRLARFLRRHGNLFRGQEKLGYEETLGLIDRIEGLKDLQSRLFERNFGVADREAVRDLLGDEDAESLVILGRLVGILTEAGYLSEREGHHGLSSKGIRRMGQLALGEIFNELRFDGHGRHDSARAGGGETVTGDSRPWCWGDPLHIDPFATVRNALRRKPGIPLTLHASDLEVYGSTRSTRSATVLLLDMSWSMSWEGRFAAAKKVAMALETLVRSRHPHDYFAVVGFYTRAVQIRPVDLADLSWNVGEPFTNLQDGIRLASQLLVRRGARNKQVIIITDGQPTAYFSEGRLYCEWPMTEGGLSTRASTAALREVERVTHQGIVLNTFMLDDSPSLRGFVEKMTALNGGRAFFTAPQQLGRFVLVDYVKGRRKIV